MMTNRTQHRVLRPYKSGSDVSCSKKALRHAGAGGAGGEGGMFLNIWSQSTSLAILQSLRHGDLSKCLGSNWILARCRPMVGF